MISKGLRSLLFAVVAVAAGTHVQSATNFFRPIIMKAIDAPDGVATQTFSKDEPWVKLMRQRLGNEGPVTVTAKVVQRWKQAGCARVETSFNFHAVRFDEKKREMVDQGFSAEVNTCRDGQPPLEAMDLRTLNDNMSDDAGPQQSRVIRHQMIMDKDGRVRAVPVEPAASATAPLRK